MDEMTYNPNVIEDEAIAWVIRTRDPGFTSWDAFTQWLEKSSENSRIYDRLALLDADLGSDFANAPRPLAPPAERRAPSRRTAIGWGIAASLVAVVSYTALTPTAATTYAVETGAGQRRSVNLADGSRIDLNGSTKLILDRENQRFAQLDHGEALFTVVHDDRKPFIVESGGATLTDLGTAFNVVRDHGGIEVSVSEGVVQYAKGGSKVTLPVGRTLRVTDGQQARLGRIAPADVAGWRIGRLVYSDASFATVASDLSRNLGVEVSAEPGIASQRFSGVIGLDGGPSATLPRAGAVLGVSARNVDGEWLLKAGSDANP